jgi:hypothetical protein
VRLVQTHHSVLPRTRSGGNQDPPACACSRTIDASPSFVLEQGRAEVMVTAGTGLCSVWVEDIRSDSELVRVLAAVEAVGYSIECAPREDRPLRRALLTLSTPRGVHFGEVLLTLKRVGLAAG